MTISRENETSKEEPQIKQIDTKEVEEWFHEHAEDFYRYSLLRVRDREKSESFVEDTFLTALRSKNKIPVHSSVRSWLLGILINKIAAYFRNKARF